MVESLREELDELYPGEFLPPRQKGNFVVWGSGPERRPNRAAFLFERFCEQA